MANITVRPYRQNRFQIEIDRGQFVSGFDVNFEEALELVNSLVQALRETDLDNL